MRVERFVFSVSDIGHPYSLDVFEGHVYWTTKDKGEVWRTNKFGRGNKVKVLTINPWLTQVRIYQEHRHNQTGQNILISNTNPIIDMFENNDTEALTSRGECSLLVQQCCHSLVQTVKLNLKHTVVQIVIMCH